MKKELFTKKQRNRHTTTTFKWHRLIAKRGAHGSARRCSSRAYLHQHHGGLSCQGHLWQFQTYKGLWFTTLHGSNFWMQHDATCIWQPGSPADPTCKWFSFCTTKSLIGNALSKLEPPQRDHVAFGCSSYRYSQCERNRRFTTKYQGVCWSLAHWFPLHAKVLNFVNKTLWRTLVPNHQSASVFIQLQISPGKRGNAWQCISSQKNSKPVTVQDHQHVSMYYADPFSYNQKLIKCPTQVYF